MIPAAVQSNMPNCCEPVMHSKTLVPGILSLIGRFSTASRQKGLVLSRLPSVVIREANPVTTLRCVLSAVAAVFVALLGFGLVFALRVTKATGLAAVAGGCLEGFFSPLFWILAVSLFALFFAASRLNSKPLRIFLFWIPVTAISIVGLGGLLGLHLPYADQKRVMDETQAIQIPLGHLQCKENS